jgi:hypothetical protein
MATASTEKQLAEAIEAAVAPVQFFWGWSPLESSNLEPSLPLVVLVRSLALAAPYEDMCEADDQIKADTSVSIHVWARGYEEARELMRTARQAANDMTGWALQSETDQFDSAFRAWLITADWRSVGLRLE